MGDSGTPSAFTKPDTPTYPPLPGVFDVPWHLIGPWSHAQTHIWLVWLYLDGLDGYVHHRELTTGCTCRDKPRWYPGRPANPDCPTHSHQPTALPPCSCHYGLHTTSLPYQQSATRVRRRTVVHGSYFAIDRDCLHHGDATLVYPLHSPVDPAFWDLLDEHERRNY